MTYYTVKPGHPRLCYQTPNLVTLQSRVALGGTHRAEWDKLIIYLEENLGSNNIWLIDDHCLAHNLMKGNAGYPNYNDPGHVDYWKYGKEAAVIMDYALTNSIALLAVQNIQGLIGWDEIFDVLSLSENATLKQNLYDYLYGQVQALDLGTYAVYHEGCRYIIPSLIGSLAIYGGGSEAQNSTISSLLTSLITQWESGVLAGPDEVGRYGGWHSFSPYGLYKAGDIYTIANALLQATDLDYFTANESIWDYPDGTKGLSGSDHLRYQPLWWLYNTKANYAVNKLGDGYLGSGTGGAYIAAQIYKNVDSNLASLYQWFEPIYNVDELNGYDMRGLILQNDKTIIPLSPGEAGYPKCKFFNDIGAVVMRNGWDLSDTSQDIYAIFLNTLNNIHNGHNNVNSFMINRGTDYLVTHGGFYDSAASGGQMNYFRNSFAKNTVVVEDRSQISSPYWADLGDAPLGFVTSRKNYRGEIGKFEDDNDYTYLSSNGTGAYNTPYSTATGVASDTLTDDNVRIYGDGRIGQYLVILSGTAQGNRYEITGGSRHTATITGGDLVADGVQPGDRYSFSTGLESFTRQSVYLKPDLFVVFDRVKSAVAAYSKKWLLHTIDEPAISGSIIDTQVTNHIETYDGDMVTVTRGSSKLFSKTLLPASHKITRIGGCQNDQPSSNLVAMPKTSCAATWPALMIEYTDTEAIPPAVRNGFYLNGPSGSTVEITVNELILRDSGDNEVANYSFADPNYDTIQEILDGINSLGGGWTASVEVGYQYWAAVSGVYNNWPLGGDYGGNDDKYAATDEVGGAWRIEVEPTVAQIADLFLHVLYAADSEGSLPTTTLVTSANGELQGALIDDGVIPKVVMFSKTEGIISSFTYTAAYAVELTGKHLVVDLEPNTVYHIYKNGEEIPDSPKVASAQGTIYFEALGGSIFSGHRA